MLTSRIRLLPVGTEEEETQEDILSSSLAVIFPDDIMNQHGDAENSVIYASPSFGDVTLSLADPEGEGSRSLFSHFVWNAAVELAVLIEGEVNEGEEAARAGVGKEVNWDVKGERVLELGAGTGLAGIIASLQGAESVVLSDYPAPEVLANIKSNVQRNIDSRRRPPRQGPGDGAPESENGNDKDDVGNSVPVATDNIGPCTVHGHTWGELTDPFSVSHAHAFTRILVADCLWMPWQHANLLSSISHFLCLPPASATPGQQPNDAGEGKVWVVAGFHTGREKMRGFYEEGNLKAAGLEIERIWERNAEGGEREWVEDRGREDATGRKRWLVIAILRRRRSADV